MDGPHIRHTRSRTNHTKLLEAVEHGDEITIARAGVPCAKLVYFVEPPKRKRELGFLAGVRPPIDWELFFQPLPEEELAAWEGSGKLVIRPSDDEQS